VSRRSYQQYCTLARALDVVGERWTLLIIRELLLGPKRFKDLLDGLPGVGRNLLAARLRHLESEGLISRRDLPPPAGSRVYELTNDGRALAPAMTELARWGAARLGSHRPNQAFRPAWAGLSMSALADRDAARDVRETYEFRIDGETFHLVADDGTVEPRSGVAHHPDLVIATDGAALQEIFSGALTPADAIGAGRVAIEGSQQALEHCLAILSQARSETAHAKAREKLV
jgi:DNA-binding HxlR family transcriptional regulator/putative sterol carrier protein